MVNALETLNIINRETWGATLSDQWPSTPDWSPVYHMPYFLVIHHTATSNQWQPLTAVQAIWRYHARTQNWGDIRYHYLIGQDGVIYEGRWRGDKPANIYVEGGQSMVSNTHKVGITLLGQFEPDAPNPPPAKPTPAALEALVRLAGAIAYEARLDPLGESIHPIENKPYPVISGHRDHYRTTCPGGNLYRLLPDIRQQVAVEVQRLRDSETPPPDPEPEDIIKIALAPTEVQVAWGKSVWSNLLWGDDDLYVGTWGDAVYYSLIEFSLPPQIQGREITAMELVLTGQSAAYLKETSGTFQAAVLEEPLRGQTTTDITFEALRDAPAIAVFSPPILAQDMAPQAENRLTLPANDLTKINQAAATGFVAVRLEGPTQGRQLFSWDSGYGQGGLRIKPALTLHYR